MRRALLPALLIAVACRTLTVTDATLLRPPPADSSVPAPVVPAPYVLEDRGIRLPDGVELHAFLYRRPGATRTVLYFGGNGFRADAMGAAAVRRMSPLEVNLVLVDHRGYGRSAGTPISVAQLEADAVVAYDAVAAWPEVASTALVVHGHSLGSFLAGAVAQRRHPAGVVLESSATTGREWIRVADRRPWFLRPFLRLEIAPSLEGAGNLPRMRSIDEPLLVLVGGADRITPPALSRALYGRAATPAALRRLAILEGAGHNDVPDHPSFAVIYREFLALVDDGSRTARLRGSSSGAPNRSGDEDASPVLRHPETRRAEAR